ncbi:MAG TPA: VacJ family lipoprotein [Nitrosomonas halophila]|nr:VacJ family lipoprotein [Nitrosomonas halophila]
MDNTFSFLKCIVLCLALMTAGCAALPNEGRQLDPHDPYERFNRGAYRFTDEIDRRFLEPIADVYLERVPEAVQRPVNNFYRNLSYPAVALNSFLQGKVRQGFSDLFRFLINSTIGIFGLADMAGHMGFQENNEDFGQTLAVWGVNSGPYIFVPVYGPSTRRDLADIPASFFSDGLFYLAFALSGPVLIPLAVLRVVDKRAALSGPMKIRDQTALDPYLFVREAFLQQREYLIHDGDLPAEHYNDLLFDDFLIEDEENNATP